MWLDSLAREDVFAYASAIRPESLWERFVGWLASLFGQTVQKNGQVIDGLLWVVLGLLVAGIVYMWFTKSTRLLRHKNLSVRGSAVDVEDIAGSDLDAVIGIEVAAQRWRSAIRYLYLRSLQDLQNAGAIVWMKDKTNRDYLREVAEPTLNIAFADAVRVFERTWYGDEQVDEVAFINARTVNDGVRQRLRASL